jgi:DNA-binding Lrp family transcriptional regulator
MKEAVQRDPGYVKLRRGLLPHLCEMSDRGAKLYVWLLLKARFAPPKRGWVEASFGDIARELGWSSKTVQRAIQELAAKGYIEVERATSQWELTRIKILKYDAEDPAFRVDKSVHSKDEGVDRGADKSVHGSVHTPTSIPQSHQDLQAPKNAVEIKKERRLDAVRRPVDAELPVMPPPFRGASRLKKKQNLTARRAKAIHVNGNQFKGGLDRDERAVLQAAINATRYGAKDSTVITEGFTSVLMEVYEKHKNDGTSPGNLCSKVIDRCLSEQEACKTLGADPSDYYWPPDFMEHRNRLRVKERATEQASRASGAVRASMAPRATAS